jgi:1,4-dihydroxy-2-naphthoyl-CoA hydrolase
MWFDTDIDLARINATANGMIKHLGIEFTAIDERSLTARMPVDERTHQPFGLLHGGATATLAETVGSFASYLTVDREKEFTVGVEITAQHIRSARSGFVYAKAIPVHLGRILHVWDIRVNNEEDKLIALCKLSVMVRPLKKQ